MSEKGTNFEQGTDELSPKERAILESKGFKELETAVPTIELSENEELISKLREKLAEYEERLERDRESYEKEGENSAVAANYIDTKYKIDVLKKVLEDGNLDTRGFAEEIIKRDGPIDIRFLDNAIRVIGAYVHGLGAGTVVGGTGLDGKRGKNENIDSTEAGKVESESGAEPEDLVEEYQEDITEHVEDFLEDLENEGDENPELSLRVEKLAAKHIAEMQAVLESFKTEVERIGERKELQATAKRLFRERQQKRDELLAEFGDDYDFRNDPDYIFLNDQHQVYFELNGKLDEDIDIDDEIEARAEANERLKTIHIEKKIDELRDLVEDLNESIQNQSRSEKMEALKKATEIINDPRYAEARAQHHKDEEEFEVPEAVEEAALVAEEMIRNLEHMRNVVDPDTENMFKKARIEQLKSLIDQLNQAVQNQSREDKMTALARATKLLDDSKYAEAKAQHHKDEEELEVPDAIEQAVLEAERRIRELEDSMAEDEPEPVKPETVEPEPVKPEPVEPEPVKPEPVEPEPVKPEPVEPEPESLEDVREAYLKALKDRNSVFSGKRVLGVFGYKKAEQKKFEEIKQKYEEAIKQEQKSKLEAKKAELLSTAESTGEIPKELFEEYLALLEAEDNKIDQFATSQEKTQFQKFQGWWKRNAKARLVVGGALFAVGGVASVTGVGAIAGGTLFGAGFALVRGTTSGAGMYMTAEATLDQRSGKVGQKGLIDDVSKMGIFKGLNVFKRGQYNAEVIEKLKKEAAEGNNPFNKYTVDELRVELGRLRALSLDKGVRLAESGRFGASQAELVKLLQDSYRDKIRNDFKQKVEETEVPEEPDVDGFIINGELHADTPEIRQKLKMGRAAIDSLSEILDRETDLTNNELVSETDKGRVKRLSRHALAAGLGLTVGMATGSRTFENIEETKGRTTWEQIKALFDDDKPQEQPWLEDSPRPPFFEGGAAAADSTDIDQLPKGFEMASAAAESTNGNIDMTTVPVENMDFSTAVEIAKGDTVWGIAKNSLIERIGADKWAELGEAKQTYLIDAIKDKIVANPAEFGIDGNVDALHVGDTIEIGKAFEGLNILEGLQETADKLSPEQMQNIVLNNEAIAKAAKAGIKIATENVDRVAAEVREHGMDFITKDGQIHEWTMNGSPVDKVGEEFVSAVSGEKIAPDNLSEVLNHAGEKAAENIAPENIADTVDVAAAAAVEDAREFSDQALQEIMAQNDPNHIEEYISDYVSDRGWSADKAKVFLSSLRDSEGHIRNDLGGVVRTDPTEMSNADLDRVLKYFEDVAVKGSFDDLDKVDAKHWSPINIGGKFYFAMKEHSGPWPLRSDSWLIDQDGDLRSDGFIKLDGGQMRQAFSTGTLDNLKELETAPQMEDVSDNFQEVGGVAESAEGTEVNEAIPEAESADIEQGSAEFHDTRIEEVQSAMDRMKEAGVFSENMSVEDIEKINDKELLEKMKQVLDDTISKQEAATAGTEQGVDRGDLVALGAVEDRLYQLELETPSADAVEVDSAPADTLPEAETVEDMPDTENISETSSLENGEFKTAEGHSAQFEYDADGKVSSVRINGSLSGRPELLNDDFRAKVMEAWENSGRKGDIQLNIDKVTMTARNLQLQNEILENMKSAGLGESPEANFLKKMIESRIETTEKFYGDVFRE